MRGTMVSRGRGRERSPGYLVITDPGPDPDDVKCILVLAVQHLHRNVTLHGVVCNGGGHARSRAKLARCLLRHMGIGDFVRVGVGSQGKYAAPNAYEFDIQGYADTLDDQLEPGHAVIHDTLLQAPPKSLTVVLISSMRDFADEIMAHPSLVKAKVLTVAIQGGLEPVDDDPLVPATTTSSRGQRRRTSSTPPWRPDESTNNLFDMEAATCVYRFCFEQGVPMTVTSRAAVPMLPMQLARSFADRTKCPLMCYLANAQFSGLEGLWAKLCAGKLPARCDKRWYFAVRASPLHRPGARG